MKQRSEVMKTKALDENKKEANNTKAFQKKAKTNN